MNVRDNPKNYTYQLMQPLLLTPRRAQDQRVLMGKISSMKSSVDNKSPSSYVNSASASYSKQRAVRKREIEVENNALLKKMIQILNRQEKSQTPFGSSAKRIKLNQSNLPGGGIITQGNGDMNYRNRSLDRNSYSQSISPLATSEIMGPSMVQVGSLNYFQRKKYIQEINKNNKQFLKSLKNVQPTLKNEQLKSHQERLSKLKSHLVNVRYGQQSNFVFPLTPTDNHNFNSSRFLFVKNPSIINIHYPKRNKQSEEKRRLDMVSMGNYLNQSQRLSSAKRLGSPQEDGGLDMSGLLNQTQKLKNARKKTHHRVQTAHPATSKLRHKKQNIDYQLENAMTNSQFQGDFDNTRLIELEDRDPIINRSSQDDQFASDQINLRINNGGDQDPLFQNTQASSQLNQVQKTSPARKILKRKLLIQTGVVGIDIAPQKREDEEIGVKNSGIGSRYSSKDRLMEEKKEISKGLFVEAQQELVEQEVKQTPLSKRKIVAQGKLIMRAPMIIASIKGQKIKEVNQEKDQYHLPSDQEDQSLRQMPEVPPQLQVVQKESSEQDYPEDEHTQAATQYFIKINDQIESTKKMLDLIGLNMQQKINETRQSNQMGQPPSFMGSNIPSSDMSNHLKMLDSVNMQFQQLPLANIGTMGVQNQVINMSNKKSESKPPMQEQEVKMKKGKENQNVQWFLQKLKNMILVVKTKQLLLYKQKMEEEKAQQFAKNLNSSNNQASQGALKRYNVTSFIGSIAQSMNQPAFFRANTKVFSSQASPPQNQQQSLTPKFLLNECVRRFLSRLLSIASKSNANKNIQTDFSYKFDQQTSSLNYESEGNAFQKIIKEAKKGHFIEEEKLSPREENGSIIEEEKVNNVHQSQPVIEDECSINYSEKFESIKEEKFSQKPSLKQQELMGQNNQKQQESQKIQLRKAQVDGKSEEEVKQILAKGFANAFMKPKSKIIEEEKQIEQKKGKDRPEVIWLLNKFKEMIRLNKQEMEEKSKIKDNYLNYNEIMNERSTAQPFQSQKTEVKEKAKEKNVLILPEGEVKVIFERLIKLNIKTFNELSIQRFVAKLIEIAIKSRIPIERLREIQKAKQDLKEALQMQKAKAIILRQARKSIHLRKLKKEQLVQQLSKKELPAVQIFLQKLISYASPDYQHHRDQQNQQSNGQLQKTSSESTEESQIMKRIISHSAHLGKTLLNKSVYKLVRKLVKIALQSRISEDELIEEKNGLLKSRNAKLSEPIQVSVRKSIRKQIMSQCQSSENSSLIANQKVNFKIMSGETNVIDQVEKMMDKIIRKKYEAPKNKNVNRLIMRVYKIALKSRLQYLEYLELKAVDKQNQNHPLKLKPEHVQKFIHKLLFVAIRSRIDREELAKIKLEKLGFWFKKKLAVGMAKMFLMKRTEEVLERRQVSNRKESVQKFIDRMIRIAEKSKIPRGQLDRMKVLEEIRKLKMKFALGFRQRMKEKVPEQIIEALIQRSSHPEILQSPQVQWFIKRIMSIALESRLTKDELDAFIQQKQQLKQEETQSEERIAYSYVNELLQKFKSQQASEKVKNVVTATKVLAVIRKPKKQASARFKKLIMKHVDGVKKEEQGEQQAQALLDSILEKRPHLQNQQGVQKLIKKVFEMAIKSRIPPPVKEEQVLQERKIETDKDLANYSSIAKKIFIGKMTTKKVESSDDSAIKGREKNEITQKQVDLVSIQLQSLQSRLQPKLNEKELSQLLSYAKRILMIALKSRITLTELKASKQKNYNSELTRQISQNTQNYINRILKVAQKSQITMEELKRKKQQILLSNKARAEEQKQKSARTQKIEDEEWAKRVLKNIKSKSKTSDGNKSLDQLILRILVIARKSRMNSEELKKCKIMKKRIEQNKSLNCFYEKLIGIARKSQVKISEIKTKKL